MAVYIVPADRTWENAFSNIGNTVSQAILQQAERKRQEEANAMLGQMYLDAMRQPADAAVAPRIADATQAGNALATAQGNLSALNAPITTSDGLADTRAVRAILKDPQGMDKLNAMQTPEMPVDTTQLQSYNQALAPAMQAQVNQLQSQDNQAQQMLAAAKEKYGTAMFDRLAPIVASGKVPFNIVKSMLDNQIANAEAQANKLAISDATKVIMNDKSTDQERQAAMITIGTIKPELGRMFQNMFAPKDNSFTLSPGQTRFVNGKPVANLPAKDPAIKYTVITNPDGSQDKVGDNGSVTRIRPATAERDAPGNLTRDERKRHDDLKDYLTEFEKKHKTPTGNFDSDKAESDPEYADYQKYKEEYRILKKKSLEPKQSNKKTITAAELDTLIGVIMKQKNKTYQQAIDEIRGAGYDLSGIRELE